MTGLFEFVCLALLKPFGPYVSFAAAETALASHCRTCDECALTGSFVEPHKEATPAVVVPNAVAKLVLSREELSRNVYQAHVPALDAGDLLGRALIVEAMLPSDDVAALADRIHGIAELARAAQRDGLRVFWE